MAFALAGLCFGEASPIVRRIMRSNHCFLLGAAKAGTSSLFDCFGGHPQIARTRPKETRNFSGSALSPDAIEAFKRKFVGSPEATVFVEASTENSQYPLHPRNAENIRRAFPDALYLYVLRDPLKRIESHYNYSLQKGFCGLNTPMLSETFIVPSLYATQLGRYRPEFEEGRAHLISYEQFKSDPAGVIRAICDFLKVEALPLEEILKPINPTRGYTVADRLEYGLRIAGLGCLSSLLVNRCTRTIRPFSKVIPRSEVSDAMLPAFAHRLTGELQILEDVFGFSTSQWTYTREKLQIS